VNYPSPKFDHLFSLVGPFGIFEHAEHNRARIENGYCVDDVARVLLVVAKEHQSSQQLDTLMELSLSFLEGAQSSDGTFQNRRSPSGECLNEDCWGRAVWALGTTVVRHGHSEVGRRAGELLERSLLVRSPWPRSMAFATLGAVEVLGGDQANPRAVALVQDAMALLDRPVLSEDWLWPEERLSYANAVLAESLLAGGSALKDQRLIEAGLAQLRWLVATESRNGHLSVTSSKGRRRMGRHEAFDQQPIEVATLCDACARAGDLTGESKWSAVVDLAAQWFLGNNDIGAVMFDPLTGGGFDGLCEHGPNLNQGAESTLALLATLQRVRQIQLAQ
jgi:hypothetical protein